MENRPLVLGHRGASHACPENTLAAFAQARAFGADGVELDVRRTADDRLVVHHDPHVDGFGLIVHQPYRGTPGCASARSPRWPRRSRRARA